MESLSAIPFERIRFSADGDVPLLWRPLVPEGTTDVIVLAHGWKNDEDDANRLYAALLQNIRNAAGQDFERRGRWAALGVYWPAFRFRDDLTLLPIDGSAAGGAASLDGDDLERAELATYAREVASDLNSTDPSAFAAIAVDAAGGGGPADLFADRLRALLSIAIDPAADCEHVDLLVDRGRDLIAEQKAGGVFAAAVDEAAPAKHDGSGGAAAFDGVASALERLKSGGAAAVARLLNQATYFEMKARSGVVGRGLATRLRDGLPAGTRIHLVGHSFGGRLVTAAAACDDAPAIESLSLLQAAYSHNGLGTGFGDDGQTVGAFRAIVAQRRVAGAIVITHTLRDRAVGLAYAIASAASGVIASALGLNTLIGGPRDPHGGMGANGARSMLEAETTDHIAAVGSPIVARRGVVNNVLADAIISSHNDVANEDVGAVVWSAIAAS